jgi:hypothetical protein
VEFFSNPAPNLVIDFDLYQGTTSVMPMQYNIAQGFIPYKIQAPRG